MRTFLHYTINASVLPFLLYSISGATRKKIMLIAWKRIIPMGYITANININMAAAANIKTNNVFFAHFFILPTCWHTGHMPRVHSAFTSLNNILLLIGPCMINE